jgi:hypothetical protein
MVATARALTADPSPVPDDPLLRAALQALQGSGYLVLRSVRCDVEDGVIVLSGTVPSFYLKQVAQAVLLRLGGIRAVRNAVEVRGAVGGSCG